MRLLLVALVPLVAACGPSRPTVAPGTQSVRVFPSRSGDLTFSRADGDAVETVFVNGSARAVYSFVASGDTVLERWEGDEWVEQPVGYVFGGPPYLVPIPIEPGEYYPLTALPLRKVDVGPGTYRVKARVYEDAGRKRLLPVEERVSRPFEIVR